MTDREGVDCALDRDNGCIGARNVQSYQGTTEHRINSCIAQRTNHSFRSDLVTIYPRHVGERMGRRWVDVRQTADSRRKRCGQRRCRRRRRRRAWSARRDGGGGGSAGTRHAKHSYQQKRSTMQTKSVDHAGHILARAGLVAGRELRRTLER